MKFQYETERLVLRICDSSEAPSVLAFLLRNRVDFEQWQNETPENYYTIEHQEARIAAEMKLMLSSRGVRFYMFEKKPPIDDELIIDADKRIDPNYLPRVVGSVSFSYLTEDFGHRCCIGYKTDRDYRHKGYTREAADFLIRIMAREYKVRRFEADIHPENLASKKTIEALGFTYEGIARGAHNVRGVETDHLRYSLLSSEL